MPSARPPRPRYVEITWGDAGHCPHPDVLSNLEGEVYVLMARTTATKRARLPVLLYVGVVEKQRDREPHPASSDIRNYLLDDRTRRLFYRGGRVEPIEEPLSRPLVRDVVECLVATNAPLFVTVDTPRPRQQGIVVVNKGTFLPLVARSRCC
jgi:hypothetical protein